MHGLAILPRIGSVDNLLVGTGRGVHLDQPSVGVDVIVYGFRVDDLPEVWAQKIAECDQRRSAYQDQQAAGLMTLEELGSKLRELDNTCGAAERELAALKDHRRRVEDLVKDRDALLGSMTEMVPDALDSLTGEEKNRVYRMLRLEVAPTAEGYDLSGALCDSATPSV